MFHAKAVAALCLAVSLTAPALAGSPAEPPGNVLMIQYQDPSATVYQWQQPGGWAAPRQRYWNGYQQQQIDQERRWRAYQHQRRLEAQRQWQAHQQWLHEQWQRRAYGVQPPPPRRLDPLRRQPESRQASPERREGGPRPEITAVAPEIVAFANSEAPGTIVIDASARTLYYTLSESEAYAYPVSVGREGFGWQGSETVSRVASWPDWHPPESMRERQPELPKMMTGGINNPLGARAIYLGDTLYRIHGTNEESSIGQAASSGCFRMRNEHVVHLARLVEIGAKVRVVDSWPSGGVAQVGEPG